MKENRMQYVERRMKERTVKGIPYSKQAEQRIAKQWQNLQRKAGEAKKRDSGTYELDECPRCGKEYYDILGIGHCVKC